MKAPTVMEAEFLMSDAGSLIISVVVISHLFVCIAAIT